MMYEKTHKMGYYLPVAEDKVAEWEDYRNQFLAWRESVRALADEIGAEKIRTGFAGSITGVIFKDESQTHLAFSKQTDKHGCHPVLSRGRSDEQKAAIKEFSAKNAAVSSAKPIPEKLAAKHGFITHFEYETDGENGGTSGHVSIGNPFSPIQAAWFDHEGVIMVYAPDANAEIQSFKDRHAENVNRYPKSCHPLVSITPESWETPDGYERITEAKWNAMKWMYLYKKGLNEND